MQLDEQLKTPVDLLRLAPVAHWPQANALLQALQASLNPSAPTGYIKPDAFHGSPWGLEIIASGELRGGANDAKGGKESLEGQVFFSDRTAEHHGDATTRPNLRRKARLYADGKGTKPSCPSNRGLQYRMIQAMKASTHDGSQLNLTRKPVSLEVADISDVDAAIKATLQSVLTDTGFMFPRPTDVTLELLAKEVNLPAQITISVGKSGEEQTFAGVQLHDLYIRLIDELGRDLEDGKAPLMSLINNGSIVPLVFGFTNISDLKQHAISGSGSEPPKYYSYQEASHPLAGSEKGGRLQEIEVRSLQDLATLILACEAKGIALPSDIAVRVNPPARAKKAAGSRALYLTPDQIRGLKSGISREVAKLTSAKEVDVPSALGRAPIPVLQDINAHIRNVALEEFVPERLQDTLSK